MSEDEKELVRFVFTWIDSFGPGVADLRIGEDASEDELTELLATIGPVL